MEPILPGQSNDVTLDMVASASDKAITSGTVTFYLYMKRGPQAGKWFRASDSTWQTSESSAGIATHKGTKALWALTIVAAAWLPGSAYDLYGVESGNLQIDYSKHLATWSAPTTGTGEIEWVYTLTSTAGGNPPIVGAKVWATTDAAGDHVVAADTTNEFGKVTFYLAAGTYYYWRDHPQFNFDDPDVEVVS